jgi:hypothetical protein
MPLEQAPTGPRRPEQLILALDRIERTTAILVDEQGRTIALPMERLPRNPPPAEGDVLRVPVDASGRPRWPDAAIDRAETDRRRAAAAETLERLRKRDPGGDVKL